jgi:tagatose-1,6-bisphosphate aldolase non-catalytic subunit AgaZ/GatZ
MIAKINSPVSSTSKLAEILQQNRAGQTAGVVSISSANRCALEGRRMQAKQDNGLPLIESAFNQVNPFGGNMRNFPENFYAACRTATRHRGIAANRRARAGARSCKYE